MWVLGIDPKFSGRAASVLNCWGSPVPCYFLTQHRTTSPQWPEPSHINYQSRQCAPGVPTGQCDVGVFKLRVLSSQMALPCVRLILKTSSPEEPKEGHCLSKRERDHRRLLPLRERSQQKTPTFLWERKRELHKVAALREGDLQKASASLRSAACSGPFQYFNILLFTPT